MALDATTQRLVDEVTETRGREASIIALVHATGQMLRDLIASNANLAEMRAAISAAADSLDAGQTEIAAAVEANPLPGETPTEPEE